MKIRNRPKTCSHLSERYWCSSRVLIEVADEPTCCFLFQSTTPVWLARSRTNGRSRCTGTCARARNAGRSSSLPATASSFGRSSIRCCTTRRTESTEFTTTHNSARIIFIVIFGIFFIKINLFLLWHDAVAISYFSSANICKRISHQ